MSSIIKVDTIQTAAGGTPTAADLGINTTGSVLQVVQDTQTTQVVVSATSFIASPLSATITPSATSSKILAVVSYHGGPVNSSAADANATFALSRDAGSTYLAFNGIRGYDYGGSGTIVFTTNTMVYLDSPSSTSSLTYTVYHKKNDGNSLYLCPNDLDNRDTLSSITLMEIAG